MLNAEERDALSRMGPYASKYDLGKIVAGKLGCVLGTYKFSRDGGAVGSTNLKAVDGTDLKLPSGAVVCNAFVHVKTQATSGGSATIAFSTGEDAADLLAATAVASFTDEVVLQGVPDFATVADYALMTAENTCTCTIGTAALTAGEINVWIFYVYAG